MSIFVRHFNVLSVLTKIRMKTNPPDTPIGKIRVRNNKYRGSRLVYIAKTNAQCYHCGNKIIVGERFTRRYGYNNAVCVKCQPIRDILPYVERENPLRRWTESSDWFENANGNAPEIIAEIARACGYESFKPTRSFANMVGYRIEKYHDKTLALRYFRLLDEAAEHFPEVKSESRLIIEAVFGE